MAGTNDFSENALRILKARYYIKNEKGDFLDKSPSDLFRRVANFIASAEKTKKQKRFLRFSKQVHIVLSPDPIFQSVFMKLFWEE